MKILILGGTGMIGHKLWQHLKEKFLDVYVTIRKSKTTVGNIELFNSANVLDCIDVTDFGLLEKLLYEIRPNVIINAIGVTKRNPEANNVELCLQLNSLLPHMLARWGRKNGARVIQFGTDCIFDGKVGGYLEESPPTAIDIYGRTKSLGELYGENCLTLRTSFIGRELFAGTELLEWFLAQDGKIVKGFKQAFYTGVSTIFLSKVVSDLIVNYADLSGAYNLASEIISKYDLLYMIREAFKLNIELLPDDSIYCARNLIGNRFINVTGMQIPSWKEMVFELANDNDIYKNRKLCMVQPLNVLSEKLNEEK